MNPARTLLDLFAIATVVATTLAAGPPATASASATGGCQLNSAKGQIQHVIV